MSDTKTIKFEGLKGVGNVELDLRADQRVYAFIGTNGVGKTKVLEALFQTALLSNSTFTSHAPNQQYGHQNVATKVEVVDDFSINFQAGVANGWRNTTVSPNTYKKSANACVYIGAQSHGHIEVGNHSQQPIGSFETRRINHMNKIVSGMMNNFLKLGMEENLNDWFVGRAHSANPFQKTNDNRKVEIDVLLNALHKIDNRISENFLEIDGDHKVRIKINSEVTELKHLSSGFASLVKILQAIIAGYANFTNETNLTHVKGIVLIDEIESHLHIEWQAKIIPLLNELFPNTTFYVATHSALVLTQLQQGEAYLLKRDEADGVVRSELIQNPNKKLFDDVLNDAFGINLNKLKREQMDKDDQATAKKMLLDLLNETEVAQ